MATMKPTEGMARNAARSLEVRASKPPSQRGMTAVGIRRATQIKNREAISLDTAKRILLYLGRHVDDKKGETWDEKGKGWQAWNGWGGDEAVRPVARFVRQEDPEWYNRWRDTPTAQALIDSI